MEEEPVEMPPPEALLNDVILWELSNYLSHSDLKSLRNVCHTWNYNMRNLLFKCSTVHLNTMARMTRFVQETSSGDWNLPGIKLRISPSSQNDYILPSDFNCFFDKYEKQIQRLQFRLDLNANRTENLLEWLELLDGYDNLVELSLNVRFYGFFQITEIDLDSIPVLRSLRKFDFGMKCKLHGHHSEGWETEIQMFRTWSQIILRMAPEISSLGIKDIIFWKYNTTDYFQRQFFSLLNTPNNGLPNLKDVRVIGNVESLATLPQIPNPLTKLTIIWNNAYGPRLSSGNWKDLTKLLEKQSQSLKEFKLSFQPEVEVMENPQINVAKIGLRFPQQMPELKALHLQFIPVEEEDFRIDFKMSPVNYPKMFPKIEVLTLDNGGLSRGVVNDVFLPRKMPICQTLKRLFAKDPRRKLRNGFPNAVIERRFQDEGFWKI